MSNYNRIDLYTICSLPFVTIVVNTKRIITSNNFAERKDG